MFAIDEASIEAVRQAFVEGGELAAAVELRRRFTGLSDLATARRVVRLLLCWQPAPRSDAADPG